MTGSGGPIKKKRNKIKSVQRDPLDVAFNLNESTFSGRWQHSRNDSGGCETKYLFYQP